MKLSQPASHCRRLFQDIVYTNNKFPMVFSPSRFGLMEFQAADFDFVVDKTVF